MEKAREGELERPRVAVEGSYGDDLAAAPCGFSPVWIRELNAVKNSLTLFVRDMPDMHIADGVILLRRGTQKVRKIPLLPDH